LAKPPLREIGYVAGAHGLTGELICAHHHPTSDCLLRLDTLVLVDKSGRSVSHEVQRVRPLARGYGVQLAAVHDRTGALALKGAKIFASEAELPVLDDGDFYLQDVVGFQAVGPDGALLGRIEGFLWTNIDIMSVRRPGGRETLIPLLPGALGAVNWSLRQVEVSADPALLEDDDGGKASER
jgi:16S rRNA processing protein RimM